MLNANSQRELTSTEVTAIKRPLRWKKKKLRGRWMILLIESFL